MSERKFLVKGSSDTPYEVTFIKDAENLSAYCSCRAGKNGQNCKHRFTIMEGIGEGVINDNPGSIAEVASWVQGTDVGLAWDRLRNAERELEKFKKEVKRLKKELAARMRD